MSTSNGEELATVIASDSLEPSRTVDSDDTTSPSRPRHSSYLHATAGRYSRAESADKSRQDTSTSHGTILPQPLAMSQIAPDNGYTQSGNKTHVQLPAIKRIWTMPMTSRPVMTFQQILAIPIGATPSQPPTTLNRPQGAAVLLRAMKPRQNSVFNMDVLYRLVASGAVEDPYPHYLWAESKKLISWILDMLIFKLNTLLEQEARGLPKMKLIRSMKPGMGEGHAVLAKWCRTGQRKKLQLRAYDDWISLLETFDLESNLELKITDMVVLVTEAYQRVSGGVAAADTVPQPQVMPTLNQPSAFHKEKSVCFASFDTYSPQGSPPKNMQQSHNGYVDSSGLEWPVYRDREPLVTSPMTPVRPCIRSKTNDLLTTKLPNVNEMTRHELEEDLTLLPSVYNNYHSALGKRKASVIVNGENVRSKISRQNVEDFNPKFVDVKVKHVLNYAIDPALPEGGSSSPTSQHFSKAEVDVLSYLDTLRYDFSQMPDDFEEIETMDAPLPPDSTFTLTNQWLNEQIKLVGQQFQPFRCLPAPMEGDYSRLARCIRFAQLHSQKDVQWRIHRIHVAEIEKLTNWYGMELLQSRNDIAFGTSIPSDLRMEFEACLALRFAQANPDTAYTAACIDMICGVLETEADPEYVLSLLTSEDKARFPEHVAAWEDRCTALMVDKEAKTV